LKAGGETAQRIVLAYQKDNREQFAKVVKEGAAKEREDLSSVGVEFGEGGALIADVSKMSKKDQAVAQDYLKTYGQLLAKEAQTGDYDVKAHEKVESKMKGLSIAGLRQLSVSLGGKGESGKGAEIAGVRERFGTMAWRYGSVGAAARMIGVDMSSEEQKSWTGKGGVLTPEGARMMLDKAGIKGKEAEGPDGLISRLAGKKGDALADVLREVMVKQRDKELADQKAKEDKEQTYKTDMRRFAESSSGYLKTLADKADPPPKDNNAATDKNPTPEAAKHP
jgi:hypothetical protein